MKKLLFVLLVLLTGCSPTYVPFTQQIKVDLELANTDFAKVQFGIKDKIVLKRVSYNTKEVLDKGTLKKQTDVLRENIRFQKSGTNEVLEGLCKDVKSTMLALYFEEGDLNKKRIVFRQSPDNTFRFFEGVNTVEYDGEKYQILQGSNIRLYISKKEITNQKEVFRKASGLKVK